MRRAIKPYLNILTTSYTMGGMTSLKKTDFIILSVIVALAAWVFSGSMANHFTNWDDPFYLGMDAIQNFDLHGLFTTPILNNYFPMILMGFAIDTAVCYPDAWCFHLASLLFHLGNIILFYWLIRKLFKDKIIWAALPTLFFALHPMQVESVAWMSSANYPQSFLFFLAGWHFYLEWKKNTSTIFWILSFFAFVIGLLTKHVVFVLPIILVILEYNYFPRRPWRALIPFFIASLIAGVTSVVLYQENNLSQVLMTSFPDRAQFFLDNLIFYAGKLFVPLHQSAFYDYFSYQFEWYDVLGLVAILTLMAAGVWKKFYRDPRWRILLLISAVLIFPFLKLVPFNSSSAFNDRYFYYPLGFVAVWITYSLSNLLPKNIFQLASAFLIVVGLGFAVLSHERVGVWQDPTTLWNDVLQKNPHSAAAHFKLAELQMNLGNWPACLEQTKLGTASNTLYSAVLYYVQAQCQEHLELKSQARLSLQESLKAQTDFAPAKIMLENLERGM